MYIGDAHPKDGWKIGINDMDGTAIARNQTTSIDNRRGGARKLLELNPGDTEAHVVVDSMDNTLVQAYEAMTLSLRLYAIHKQQVASQGRVGPYKLSPESLKTFLSGWEFAK